MSAFSIGATLLDAMVLAILSQADTYGYQITPAGRDLLEQYRQDWIIYQEQVNFFLGKPKK